MSKSIKSIVITGGPCSGKTTGMAMCCQALRNRGYKVIVVPETATLLINSGIAVNNLDTFDFQDLIFDIQMCHERIWERGIKKLPNEDIIILFDRGIMDNKAYMTSKDFSTLMVNYDTDERSLYERYNAVIHMVTAADGAEEYYTLDTNAARTETPEQARVLDKKTLNAWNNHPYHKVIDNTINPTSTKSSFEQKMDRLINEIFEFLQIPYYDGMERKYLVEMPDINMLKCFIKCIKSEDMIWYLAPNEDSKERRIVQQKYEESTVYSYMEKREKRKNKIVVIEKNLTSTDFLNMLSESDIRILPIRKTRYCFTYEDKYFELNIYPNLKNKAILTVVQDDEEEEICIPKFVSVIEEISDNQDYLELNIGKIED